MSRPLLDHDGARLSHREARSLASLGVRFTAGASGVSPVALMRKTEGYPSRVLMNAISFPFGDHAAIWLNAAPGVGVKVSCSTFCSSPSASATKRLLPRRKARRLPSG